MSTVSWTWNLRSGSRSRFSAEFRAGHPDNQPGPIRRTACVWLLARVDQAWGAVGKAVSHCGFDRRRVGYCWTSGR